MGDLAGSAGRHDHRHLRPSRVDRQPHGAQHGVNAVSVCVAGQNLPHRTMSTLVPPVVVGKEHRQGTFGLGPGSADDDEVGEELLQRTGVPRDHRRRTGRQFEDPAGAHRRRLGHGVHVEEDLVRLVGGKHPLIRQRPDDVPRVLRRELASQVAHDPGEDVQAERAGGSDNRVHLGDPLAVPVGVVGASERDRVATTTPHRHRVVHPRLRSESQEVHPGVPELFPVRRDAVGVDGEDLIEEPRALHEAVEVGRILLVPEHRGDTAFAAPGDERPELVGRFAGRGDERAPASVVAPPHRLDEEQVGAYPLYDGQPVVAFQRHLVPLVAEADRREHVEDDRHRQVWSDDRPVRQRGGRGQVDRGVLAPMVGAFGDDAARQPARQRGPGRRGDLRRMPGHVGQNLSQSRQLPCGGRPAGAS